MTWALSAAIGYLFGAVVLCVMELDVDRKMLSALVLWPVAVPVSRIRRWVRAR